MGRHADVGTYPGYDKTAVLADFGYEGAGMPVPVKKPHEADSGDGTVPGVARQAMISPNHRQSDPVFQPLCIIRCTQYTIALAEITGRPVRRIPCGRGPRFRS